MIDAILTAISTRLSEVKEGCEIYSQDVEQGLSPNSFFIRLLIATTTPLLGQRKFRFYPFVITYFPTASETNDDMMTLGDRMVTELEYITMLNGDIVRGWDISYEIDHEQNVLRFEIEYRITTIPVEEIEAMQDLTQEIEIKEEG